MVTHESAVILASSFGRLLNQLDIWPEDDWLSLAEGWDLNVYQRDGVRHVVLYPVVDGMTDTSDGTEIDFSRKEVIT